MHGWLCHHIRVKISVVFLFISHWRRIKREVDALRYNNAQMETDKLAYVHTSLDILGGNYQCGFDLFVFSSIFNWSFKHKCWDDVILSASMNMSLSPYSLLSLLVFSPQNRNVWALKSVFSIPQIKRINLRNVCSEWVFGEYHATRKRCQPSNGQGAKTTEERMEETEGRRRRRRERSQGIACAMPAYSVVRNGKLVTSH